LLEGEVLLPFEHGEETSFDATPEVLLLPIRNSSQLHGTCPLESSLSA
jgi:hypothetical protein